MTQGRRAAWTARDWTAWATALGLGALGGWLATRAGLPLAWMLGAMAATTAAAIAGLPVRLPGPFRGTMLAVLGVMLGSAFTPEVMEQAGRWTLSLAALAGYVLVVTLLVWWWLARGMKFGLVTGFFAASPGGLSEMTIVGAAMGGDDRTIALVHAMRILLVVLVVPLWFRLTGQYDGTGGAALAASMAHLRDLDLADGLVLAACGGLGVAAARLVRLPAAVLAGPMIASAAAHLTGLTAGAPPLELVNLAQLATGAAIGSRFAGLRPGPALPGLAGLHRADAGHQPGRRLAAGPHDGPVHRRAVPGLHPWRGSRDEPDLHRPGPGCGLCLHPPFRPHRAGGDAGAQPVPAAAAVKQTRQFRHRRILVPSCPRLTRASTSLRLSICF